MTDIFDKTVIKKTLRGGWAGSTFVKAGDQHYAINTSKRHSGKIVTTAQACEVESKDGFITTSYGVFVDACYKIAETKQKATEKAIREQHAKALIRFDELIESGDIEAPKKKAKPTVGSILFLDGYGKTKGSENNKKVVYKIEGNKYYCVEIDSKVLTVETFVKLWSEKFGIGTYFDPNYNFTGTQDELNNLIIEAQQNMKELAEIREKERAFEAKAQKMRQDYLSQFKRADKRKRVSLMKKYVKDNFPTVEDIKITSESYSMGSNINVAYYAPEKIEALEDWVDNFQRNHFNGMEDLETQRPDQEPIIIDGYIVPRAGYAFVRWVETEAKETENQTPEAVTLTAQGIEYFDYSERAFAITGDTKPIKDQLKELGGKFNPRLKCGAGWIFSKKKEDIVLKTLNLTK